MKDLSSPVAACPARQQSSSIVPSPATPWAERSARQTASAPASAAQSQTPCSASLRAGYPISVESPGAPLRRYCRGQPMVCSAKQPLLDADDTRSQSGTLLRSGADNSKRPSGC